MSDFIGLDVYGVEEVTRKVKYITSEEAAGAGVEEANKYVIEQMRTYAPYKYVSVADAGGWKSEKQRRYVMAAIRRGEINVPYQRTQNMNRGWKAVGEGINQIVVNETPYAGYVMGDAQTKGHSLRGWTTAAARLRAATPRLGQIFARGYRRFLRSVGL